VARLICHIEIEDQRHEFGDGKKFNRLSDFDMRARKKGSGRFLLGAKMGSGRNGAKLRAVIFDFLRGAEPKWSGRFLLVLG
jgi:hypothetical protein